MKYLAVAVLMLASNVIASGAWADNDVSKVNGPVRVSAGQTVGEVSSVNGAVRIEQNVTAQDVGTVNGSIAIGERSKVQSVETVNGSVRLDDGVQAAGVESVNGTINLGKQVIVNGDITTVNGSLFAGEGAEVRGNVQNVNGRIDLTGTRVKGHLQTTSGDITVGPNSRVDGGILVKKPSMSWFGNNNRPPKVVIGDNAIVNGTLEFKREVELHVSDSAKIGKVEGATVRRVRSSQASGDTKVER